MQNRKKKKKNSIIINLLLHYIALNVKMMRIMISMVASKIYISMNYPPTTNHDNNHNNITHRFNNNTNHNSHGCPENGSNSHLVFQPLQHQLSHLAFLFIIAQVYLFEEVN